MKKKQVHLTRYTHPSPLLHREERLLILSDVHQQIAALDEKQLLDMAPTAVLLPGDTLEACDQAPGKTQTLKWLSRMSKHCPVYASLGNHELGGRGGDAPAGQCIAADFPLPAVTQTLMHLLFGQGVQVLHNQYVRHGSLVLGGLTSAAGRPIATDWLKSMMEEQGFHLLMCHHPEYYERYVRPHRPELTISGHAHGGQWRLGKQGLYAPGQGLFPKLTSGYYDEKRLLVSRGIASRYSVPRIGNPKEAILLVLTAQA